MAKQTPDREQHARGEGLIFVLVRVLLLAAGLVSCALGVSAGSKLTRETLDSSRRTIAAIALLLLGAGAIAIASAVRIRRDG